MQKDIKWFYHLIDGDSYQKQLLIGDQRQKILKVMQIDIGVAYCDVLKFNRYPTLS